MRTPPVAVAAAVLLTTSACGGAAGAGATDQPGTYVQGAPQTQQGGPDGGFPGATGEIAAISGKTLQVQSPMSGQVAVTYTGATTFTEEVAASIDVLDVGDCVMVQGEGSDTLAATSVRISKPKNGSCAPVGRGGGPRIGRGEAPPQGMPTGRPTDLPSGAPDGMVAVGAVGKVTSVDSTGFTIETTLPGDDSTTTREVTTSDDTAWTDTVSANAQALAVGRCVMAEGAKDNTGVVTARTIAVSRKVDGQCAMGAVLLSSDGRP